MIYYNADGKVASFCGNGARCIVAFARRLELIADNQLFRFMSASGVRKACFARNEKISIDFGSIRVGECMERRANGDCVLDTGSPHYVCFVEQRLDFDEAVLRGRAIRHAKEFAKQNGINVNFVQVRKTTLQSYIDHFSLRNSVCLPIACRCKLLKEVLKI